MKKLVSILLALILVLGLTLSAYAATIDSVDTDNEDTGTVSIKFQSGDNSTVYNVEVTWKSLEFTYQQAGTGRWQPESHTYSDSTEAGWVAASDEYDTVSGEGNNTITRSGAIVVANHSNAAVVVNATFANSTASQVGTVNDSVTASLSITAPQTLGSAAEHINAYDEADSVSYDLVVSGTPTADENSFGIITVRITAG